MPGTARSKRGATPPESTTGRTSEAQAIFWRLRGPQAPRLWTKPPWYGSSMRVHHHGAPQMLGGDHRCARNPACPASKEENHIFEIGRNDISHQTHPILVLKSSSTLEDMWCVYWRGLFEMKYGVCGRNCASQFSSPYTPQHQLPIGGAATRPSFLAPIG